MLSAVCQDECKTKRDATCMAAICSAARVYRLVCFDHSLYYFMSNLQVGLFVLVRK